MKGLQNEKKDAPVARTPPDAERVRERLLAWFREHRRHLPWRENRDPYRVMVSEFMLQQTRVEVVAPRFEEFLLRFPSVEQLARATREEVHDQWSGLGYYRRADLLHAAARAIAEEGGFPRSVEGLAALPGFGPYTSAAVASIAFERAVPVLDGNVERVCTRILAEAGSPKRAEVRRLLLARLREWIDPSAPGDFNEAMMELGATVCRPKTPKCGSCPLETMCRARAQGRTTDYPTRPARRLRESWSWVQFVVFDEGRERVLLVQRGPRSGQLAGRWELPGFRSRSPGDLAQEAARHGLRPGESLGAFDHSITHRDYRVELIEAEVAEGGPTGPPPATRGGQISAETCWADLVDFDARGRWQGAQPLPASSMLSKAVRALRAGASQLRLGVAN